MIKFDKNKLNKEKYNFLQSILKKIDKLKLTEHVDMAVDLEILTAEYYNSLVDIYHLIVALHEIEQIAGKALDYPYYYKDKKNFPTATKKDGVCVGDHIPETIVEELADRYTKLKKEKEDEKFNKRRTRIIKK